MGLLSGLMGNASEVDAAKLQTEFAQVLVAGERVEKAYQLVRDMFVFTDKRLIFVNRQGLTGSKVEYQSIPYRSITRFSIETAGTFDPELKMWLTGTPAPVQMQFNKKLSIHTVQSVLASPAVTVAGRCRSLRPVGFQADECVTIERLKVCPSTAAHNSAQLMATEEDGTQVDR